jgi:hypothetical protein
MKSAHRFGPGLRRMTCLAFTFLLISNLAGSPSPVQALRPAAVKPAAPQPSPGIRGPFTIEPVTPTFSNLPLREMPQSGPEQGSRAAFPLRLTPGEQASASAGLAAGGVDPLAQAWSGAGQMPAPLKSFEGMNFSLNGSGWPPDTVGDVGDVYFVQAVNTSLGVFNKSTGALERAFTYDDFFREASPPCNNQNTGDVVMVYDRFAQRWVVSDMSIQAPPYSECVAISQTSDPLGSWTFYTIHVSDTLINDYPKMGVWRDAYYLTFNMFTPSESWVGVQVWALNKADMLAGHPVRAIYYDLSDHPSYSSLLPAHALSLPAVGEAEYLASVGTPDQFQLWQIRPDFVITTNSVFTGPQVLSVPPFTAAGEVPQLGTSMTLDSLSYRPMMQLQYRTLQGVESLWLNHTVDSGGLAAPRWYELRDPGGVPVIYQQGTYQPDGNQRWMGSLAVDQDGNMALGYSLGGASLYPSIAYSGRLRGELPGTLPQGETILIQGAGYQSINNRWGDYSAMSLDPVDGCTFWYTNEYYPYSGFNWHTRIGSFKFPSCGQPKGYLTGTIRDSLSLAPLPGAPVIALSSSASFTTLTDAAGVYTMTLMGGVYTVTAGPLSPGYPAPVAVAGVTVAAPTVTHRDINLLPRSHLAEGTSIIADRGSPYGNANSAPETGEQGIRLTEGLVNDGAAPATQVTASILSGTPGVVVNTASAAYPDIAPGAAQNNLAPFEFSISSDVPCGTSLSFTKTITASAGLSRLPFSLTVGIPQPRADVFSNTVEDSAQWVTGGINNTWGITTEAYHSPSHSWADSPGNVNYSNDTNSYVQTPSFDLSGKRGVQVSAWVIYDLEPGYDFVYLEYSLDGGVSWNPTPLLSYNGQQPAWTRSLVATPMLDNQPEVALRYRLVSDEAVTGDGIHIDDIAMSYQPYTCSFVPSLPDVPSRVSPPDQAFEDSPVTFQWNPSLNGPTPQGYHLMVDGGLVTTTLDTSYALSLPIGVHTWTVTAFNASGASLAGADWTFVVPKKMYFPLIN